MVRRRPIQLPGRYTRVRSARGLLAVMAATTVGGLLDSVHGVHVVCPEHGELLHYEAADRPASNPSSPRGSDEPCLPVSPQAASATPALGAEPVPEQAEHPVCPFALAVEQAATRAAPSTRAVSVGVEPAPCRPLLAFHAPIDLAALAPSLPPPTAG
jgi:hypothetical protein